MNAIIKFSLRLPYLAFALSVFATLLLASGIQSLKINADTRAYFSEQNPHLKRLRLFEQTYDQNNNVLFVVHAKGKSVFETDVLAAIVDLTDQAWKLPNSRRVDSVTNYPYARAEDEDFILEDLVSTDPARLSERDLNEIAETALADPFLVNRLIAADGKTTGVNVNFNLDAQDSAAVILINQAALELAAQIEETHPSVEVLTTGNVVLMRTFSDAALRDIYVLVPVGLLIIALLLMLSLRSVQETTAISTQLVLIAAANLGIAGFLGMKIDQSTAVAPVIVMTLSMASTLHIVTTAKRLIAQGYGNLGAVLEAMQRNMRPIFLTSLTTSVGFLSFNFADAPPFRDLGNLVVIGIGLNLVLTFLFLPAALNACRIKPKFSRLITVTGQISKFTQSNYRSISILGPIALITIAAGIFSITLDDDFIRYFGKKYEYRVASDYAEDHLTGLNQLEFSLDTGQPDGVYDPQYQEQAEAFVNWLKSQDKVVSAVSIADITKKINKAFNGDDENYYTLPDDRETIAQYFLLYELSLPYGTDITDQISVSRSASRVNVLLQNATSGDVRALKANAEQWLVENTELPPQAEGTSINVLFAYLSTINIKKMLRGTLITFTIISFLIGFAMRSLYFGAISLATNSLPALAGFGIWGFAVGEINLAASVITAMTLGIVVDDTIHFLVNYQKHRQARKTAAFAADQVTRSVGTAILLTSVSLVAGFLVLALSDFEVNRTLGQFTAIILAIAVIVDLIILPALLIQFDKSESDKGSQIPRP